MSDQRVPIPGSAPVATPASGAESRWSPSADPNQTIQVTITLRRPQDSAAAELEKQLLSGQARNVPREQAAKALSADPRDMSAVRSFLEQCGLKIVEENAAARTLKVQGTLKQMAEAFAAQVGHIHDELGNHHLSYQGLLSVPHALGGVITSVLGLDQRPVAKPR